MIEAHKNHLLIAVAYYRAAEEAVNNVTLQTGHGRMKKMAMDLSVESTYRLLNLIKYSRTYVGFKNFAQLCSECHVQLQPSSNRFTACFFDGTFLQLTVHDYDGVLGLINDQSHTGTKRFTAKLLEQIRDGIKDALGG